MSMDVFFVFKLIYVNMLGFYKIFFKIVIFIWDNILSRSTLERIFLILTLTAGLFSLMYWMGYNSRSLGSNALHGIFSNDYFAVILTIGVLVLSSYLPVFWHKFSSAVLKILRLIQYACLAIISFIFVVTLLFPERTTPALEASFTVWFYLFGLNLICLWVTGVLGLRFKPSTR
ncbi:MAG: hypothetical protein ABUK01_16685 [Leptospirales bacterium]